MIVQLQRHQGYWQATGAGPHGPIVTEGNTRHEARTAWIETYEDQKRGLIRFGDGLFRRGSHFVAWSTNPDRCCNCGQDFEDHYNGYCPANDEEYQS